MINDAEINLKDVEATAVIFGDGTAPKFSMGLGTKLVYDGNNNGAETRGILSAELNVEGSTIELKNLNDNALRNVTGTVNNSEITVNGAEYGIKNDASISALTVTDSKITVTNTQNSTENAGIYLTGRDKLADSNSIINAKIFIDGGEDGEDVQIITINFETNGGSVICTVEKTLGEEVNLLLYTPTKSNYKFAGWYSDSELTQKVNTVTVDAPIVVYAKWDR